MPILTKRNNKTPLGIYIHIPFCRSKCQYCDFYSMPCKDDKLIMTCRAPDVLVGCAAAILKRLCTIA